MADHKIIGVWLDGPNLCAKLESEYCPTKTCELRVSIAGAAESLPGFVRRGDVEVKRYSSWTVSLGPIFVSGVPDGIRERIYLILGAEPLALVAKCPTHQTDMEMVSAGIWGCSTCATVEAVKEIPSVALNASAR